MGNFKCSGKAYQLSHSLIAFGRGETWGVGLGDAIEKQHYLPEAHTDFILAIVGEELGFAGVMLILVLLFWLVKRAIEIGRTAIHLEHIFSGLVAEGSVSGSEFRHLLTSAWRAVCSRQKA